MYRFANENTIYTYKVFLLSSFLLFVADRLAVKKIFRFLLFDLDNVCVLLFIKQGE